MSALSKRRQVAAIQIKSGLRFRRPLALVELYLFRRRRGRWRWLDMVAAVVFGREFADAEIGADLRVRQVAIRPLQVRRVLHGQQTVI
jgi:hypothetical protein